MVILAKLKQKGLSHVGGGGEGVVYLLVIKYMKVVSKVFCVNYSLVILLAVYICKSCRNVDELMLVDGFDFIWENVINMICVSKFPYWLMLYIFLFSFIFDEIYLEVNTD